MVICGLLLYLKGLQATSLYSHGKDILEYMLHLQAYGVFIDLCLIYDDLAQHGAFVYVFDHALPMRREAWKRAISKAFQRLIFTTKGSVAAVS